jgi:hypothetical protein
MEAMAEPKLLRACHRQLMFVFVPWFLPLVVKSVSIAGIWIGVDETVVHDVSRDNDEACSLWNCGVVMKIDRVCCVALNRSLKLAIRCDARRLVYNGIGSLIQAGRVQPLTLLHRTV